MRRTLSEMNQTAGPIAIYVRNKRKELGYTQPILAERIGVGLRFLRELEQGKKSIKLDKILEVLEFLGGEIQVKDRELNHETR